MVALGKGDVTGPVIVVDQSGLGVTLGVEVELEEVSIGLGIAIPLEAGLGSDTLLNIVDDLLESDAVEDRVAVAISSWNLDDLELTVREVVLCVHFSSENR